MSYLTVQDAIQMGYISEQEAASMGELGKKKKKSIGKRLKKIRKKLHKAISPVAAIKKAISKPKKKAAAPAPEVVEQPLAVVAPEAESMPVAQSLSPMPMDVPTMSVPTSQMPAAPPVSSGGGGGAPGYSGGGGGSRSYEDVDMPEEEVDVDVDAEVPQFSNPGRDQARAENATEEFLEEQTDPELNQTGPSEESTVDGLGWVIRSRPGYRQQISIMPKRSFANAFDRQTNPARRRRLARVRAPRGIRIHAGRLPKGHPGMSGILPETDGGNVGLGIVGYGAFAAARMLPGSAGALARAAGVGAMVWAGFKLLERFLQGPGVVTTENVTLPNDQTDKNTLVAAGFINPPRGGTATRKGLTGDTYNLSFSVKNRGNTAISVIAEVVVEEIPRAFGGEKVSKSRTYTKELKGIAPGENRVVKDDGFETNVQLGTADAVATLYLKTVESGIKKPAASTNYRIG